MNVRIAAPSLFCAVALAACSHSASGGLSTLPAVATPALSTLPAGKRAVKAVLYTINNNATLSGFSLNAKTGALSLLANSPFASGTNGPAAFAIALNRKKNVMYTTGGNAVGSSNVAIFNVQKTGNLKEVSDSTAADRARVPLVSPGNKFLYISGPSVIYGFAISKNGRNLSPLSGSPFPVTCPGLFCEPEPNVELIRNGILYLVDVTGFDVSSFTVGADGTLTEVAAVGTGFDPVDEAMTPDGAYLYVTNSDSANISAYSVNGSALTEISGSPFAAGSIPYGIVMTPDGKHLYVTNKGDSTISGYSVGSDGTLTPLSGSPFADGSGANPASLTLDRGAKHLYVGNEASNTVAVYSIANSSGKLKEISGSPFSIGTGAQEPLGIVVRQ